MGNEEEPSSGKKLMVNRGEGWAPKSSNGDCTELAKDLMPTWLPAFAAILVFLTPPASTFHRGGRLTVRP